MTPKRLKTASVSKTDAQNYWKRSRELLTSMRNNLLMENWNAAVIDGVHAGISANDALTVAAIGKRSTSDHHMDAVELLQQALPIDGNGETARLRRILYIKSHVEYGPSLVLAKEAHDVAQNVERFLRWAEKVFGRLIK